MVKFLIRLDDACPYMERAKWQRIENLLDKYEIKPLVGIIPANADPITMINCEDNHFWEKARKWQEKGWIVALHGYDHVYISEEGGINPFWHRSEFAGVSLDKQKEKIRNGLAVLQKYNVNPKCFFAPSHTYDENTLEALKSESDIRIISDSIGTIPYHYKGIVFIPQIVGHCTVPPLPGYWTFCLHPNVMTNEDFENTERFIIDNKRNFISFDELDLNNVKKKSLFDRLLSHAFFLMRRLKGLK